MGFQNDFFLALNEHETKLNQTTKDEYSRIIKKLNENMKMCMAEAAGSYKRMEMFIRDEIKTMKDSLLAENGDDMSDPLAGAPFVQKKDWRKGKDLNQVRSEIKSLGSLIEKEAGKRNKQKPDFKSMSSLPKVPQNDTFPDNLYNKWDNVDNPWFDDPKPKRAIGKEAKIEKIVDENELSEGYGSMEKEEEELMSENPLSNGGFDETPFGNGTLKHSIFSEEPSKTTSKGNNGRIEDYFVKLDKFVEASNQRRRLIGCKLCSTELRGDKIRLHIMKEHSDIAEKIDIKKVGIRSIKMENGKAYNKKPVETDSNASTEKGPRGRPKSNSNKDVRADALMKRMETAQQSEPVDDEEEEDMNIKPFVTNLVQTVLDTEDQNESDNEETNNETLNKEDESDSDIEEMEQETVNPDDYIETEEGLEPSEDTNDDAINDDDSKVESEIPLE